jgi:hypothetical protein
MSQTEQSNWIEAKLTSSDFDGLIQFIELFSDDVIMEHCYKIRKVKSINIEPFARRHMAAFKIQKWWLQHYYNPDKEYRVCKKRLLREFEEMNNIPYKVFRHMY